MDETRCAGSQLRDVLHQIVGGASLEDRCRRHILPQAMHQATRSPAFTVVTLWPTAMTRPAPPMPSVHGKRTG
ncbi:hypothetical protein G6F21_014728 [Rhizopus arrhizus]|nr:hypothetical protein G6F21_014728 [Rhizopus arrhizus]